MRFSHTAACQSNQTLQQYIIVNASCETWEARPCSGYPYTNVVAMVIGGTVGEWENRQNKRKQAGLYMWGIVHQPQFKSNQYLSKHVSCWCRSLVLGLYKPIVTLYTVHPAYSVPHLFPLCHLGRSPAYTYKLCTGNRIINWFIFHSLKHLWCWNLSVREQYCFQSEFYVQQVKANCLVGVNFNVFNIWGGN